MNQVYCSNCGLLLTAESEGAPRQPCSRCSSTNRTFKKRIESTVNFSTHVMGEVQRDNQLVGFVEGERPDITRHATLTADGEVLLNLRGLSPRNEQDSDAACKNLVGMLNAGGLRVEQEGPGEQDEDFVLIVNGARIGVQVVRALTEHRFWTELARSGDVSDVVMTIPEAAAALRTAIEHKTKIPPLQRSELILLLDAYRLPALALGPVIDQFKRQQAIWAQSLGFHAIYIAGPTAIFVSRLDE